MQRDQKTQEKHFKQNNWYNDFTSYASHLRATLPAGGLIGTLSFLTSSQLVLNAVPPLSWKLFIIAFRVSSSASLYNFWKNSLRVLSPLTFGSSDEVLSFCASRAAWETLSQFVRAMGRVEWRVLGAAELASAETQ